MFQVGITRNCVALADEPGLFREDYFAELGRTTNLAFDFFDMSVGFLTPAHTDRYDAIIALQPGVTAASFGPNRRSRMLVTTGSGVDTIDIDACTDAGVLLCNTPDGASQSMATGTLSFILALSYKLIAKDRLTRSGDWRQRMSMIGDGLPGKVVGSLGFGHIARALFPLLPPLGLTAIAQARNPDPVVAAAFGVELVDFDQLLGRSDFLCLNCPLTAETSGIIDARALRKMKPGASLINVSRGPLVDEAALFEALSQGRLAGAALDVFAVEPTPADNPLLGLDTVIATPHCLGFTEQSFRKIAADTVRAVVTLQQGGRPAHVLNPTAWARL
jgi:phosphoglycerate dehydrogenase-like enzyme